MLQEELQRTHPHYRVINASVSGETTSGGVRRLPAALQEHKPIIVIIELGANDALRGTALNIAEKNLGILIRQVQRAHSTVLLLGMQIPPNYGVGYAKRF